MMAGLVPFLSGALTLSFLVAAIFFLRFWVRTRDSLFLAFAVAFLLFALNQGLGQFIGGSSESIGWIYLLRVGGFVVILAAIAAKNLGSRR